MGSRGVTACLSARAGIAENGIAGVVGATTSMGDGAADVGPLGSATASASPVPLILGTAAPSLPTIAVPPASGAMFAIAPTARTADRRTLHRPWPLARTGAPWHTLNAAPPGRPTELPRKALPAGRAPRRKDEHRATTPRTHGVHVPRAVPGDRSSGWCMSCAPVDDRAPVGDSAPDPLVDETPAVLLPMLLTPTPFSIPPVPSSLTARASFLVSFAALLLEGPANASLLSLSGQIVLETLASFSFLSASSSAVVRVAIPNNKAATNEATLTIARLHISVPAACAVHVRIHFGDTRTRRKCASADLFLSEVSVPSFSLGDGTWASASDHFAASTLSDAFAFADLRLLLLRAIRDVRARVHDSLDGNRVLLA